MENVRSPRLGRATQRASASGASTAVSGSLIAAHTRTAHPTTRSVRDDGRHSSTQKAAKIRYQWRLAALSSVSSAVAGSTTMAAASATRTGTDDITSRLARNTITASIATI